MKKLKLSGMFFFVFIFMLVAQALYAQRPPARPFPEEGKRTRLREEIETMKMWKMLEVLDLSPEQSDKFLPVWREMQKAQKIFKEKRENLLNVLENALGEIDEGTRIGTGGRIPGGGVDVGTRGRVTDEVPKEKKIKDILEQLEKERVILEQAQQRFRQKAQEVLTLEQQVKLLLFEDRFEKRMMEIIRQYRERKGFEQ